MSAVLPAAALCAALGFLLGRMPGHAHVSGLLLLVVAAVAASLFAWPPEATLAAWASVIVTVAWSYLPRPPRTRLALALAVNAGLWSGAVLSGDRAGLLVALPWALVSLPSAWLIANRSQIAVKVVASWLLAVAILAIGLPTLSIPASAPDHME